MPLNKTAVLLVSIGILLLVGLGYRLPDVDQGLLVDEVLWLERSHDFRKQIFKEISQENRRYCNDIASLKHVPSSGKDWPLNISIKSHHPGYMTAILYGFAQKIFSINDLRSGADVILLRYVQSIFLILLAIIFFAISAGRSRDSTGIIISLLASLFLVTEPFLLGESVTIKQDILLTAFQVMGLIFFCQYSEKKSYGMLTGCGIFLGLALATKLTSSTLIILTFLFLLYEYYQNRKRQDFISLAYLLFLVLGIFIIVSPNIWAHPFSGIIDVIRVAKSSPQADSSKLTVQSILFYSLKMFTHFSPFVIAIVVAAYYFLLKTVDRQKKYLLVALTLILLPALFSSIKDPCYLIPFVTLSIYTISLYSAQMSSLRMRKWISVYLAAGVFFNCWADWKFHPYPMVYSWPGVEMNEDVQLERLDRSILLPQIADYLRKTNIQKLDIYTGKCSLEYYFSGEVSEVSSPTQEWFLVSQKYFHLPVASDYQLKQIFTFNNQEIFKLYRKNFL